MSNIQKVEKIGILLSQIIMFHPRLRIVVKGRKLLPSVVHWISKKNMASYSHALHIITWARKHFSTMLQKAICNH